MNLETLTLYEIMGEDFNVFLRKNDKFGYDMDVIMDETDEGFAVEGIHEYAVDSLATFCRMYLKQYDKLQEE